MAPRPESTAQKATIGYIWAFVVLKLSAPLFLAVVVDCLAPVAVDVALPVVPLAPGGGVVSVPAEVAVGAVVPVVRETGTMLVPIDARFIPLEMVAVVTQFEEDGVLKGAAGVLRSPMV